MGERLFQGEYVSSDRMLYTPSEFAKSNLLYLQEIGSLKARKTHTSKRQNLDSFLFFYVKEGSGVLDYGGREYVVRSGDCVFINCKNPYSHRTSEDLWSLEWIHFNGESALPIYLKYVERGGQPVFHPDKELMTEGLWDSLNAIARSSDYIRDIKINEKLSSLITFLMSFSWNPETVPTSGNASTLTNLKDYIDTHYNEKISLDMLADMFLINKYTLSRGFKEQFGTSIINYLLITRITHAKQLLRFTDETVEEIGNKCGISPLYYFSRIFKQIEGISPLEYRSQWSRSV
ncbi:AraC family transcriptional regulator [Butyrivibrio sp. INlla14]|uniref:AraC family transcriptional regulator n=1 Tax=Butyrivibrio sp. INlla14 TaxID=1520808 RepID=UPI0008770F96|nr:helix-turn-helix domain-containing protein [Butyrivibrio sp. INlla14]SCY25040.1 AraC-type DNA-binding protein [Butyrivibrio sp. INlla14]